MARRYYSSTAQATTLTGSVVAGTTSFVVAAATGFPSSTPYSMVVDPDTVNEEVIEVTARSGTTLTVTRGVDGTTAVSHSSGAVIRHGVSARDFDEPNDHVNATSGVHGITGSLLGATVVTNAQTSAYTLVLTDAAKVVEVSNASAVDLTIPPNSSVAFPVGTRIDVVQTGAGQVTIKAGVGVTVNANGGNLKIKGQWAAATVIKRATDTWVAVGNLVA